MKAAEETININLTRSIGTSPMALCKGVDFYDIIRKCNDVRPVVKPIRHVNKYKVKDEVFERKFNCSKLDPKFESLTGKVVQVGKRDYWVWLSGDRGWTYIKNIKLVRKERILY